MDHFIGPTDLANLAGAFAMTIGVGFALAFTTFCSWYVVGQFRRFIEEHK